MNNTAKETVSTGNGCDRPTYGKGYIFLFTDGNDEIEIHGSALSGKEVVYYNEEIVSEKRSFGITSHHLFNRGDNNYKVTFTITSLLRGAIECSLYKNGELIGQEEQTMYQGSGIKLIGLIIIFLAFGVIVGYSGASLVEAFLKWIG